MEGKYHLPLNTDPKMRRRQLRMVSSSSDEDEPPPPLHHHQDDETDNNNISIDIQTSTINFESVNLNSTNPNPSFSQPIPLDISDDDFIDVSDNLSPPSPSPPAQTNSTPVEVFDCPISGFLAGLGLRVRREWLDSCLRGLESGVSGFSSLDDVAKAKLCFEQVLFSDMNYVGAGVLPENVENMHLVDLMGPFVLQVDEIVNISRPLKGRYQNASSGPKRCLKLSMTDGVQRVFGMEYRPIKDLEVLAPTGMKVAVCNVNIRHGILMLVPEVLEVLGGQVEELDAARQRLVQEVNKPARGKRTKSGVVLPLETRATRAAWPPPNEVSAPTQTTISTSHNATPFQADVQGNVSNNVSINQQTREESTVPIQRQDHEANNSSTVFSRLDDIEMVDEVEHLSILSGDGETPFTYLASLSTKWAAMKGPIRNVQGKIKCFMTGVKSFHFKNRTTYELHAHFDDGSLISEILISHDIVQQRIGLSPEEVNAAYRSPDPKIVSDIKETLTQYQNYLVNFEGTMVVQISEASPLPVAIEMNQGCSVSDAWGLLRRLRPSRFVQQPDAINISRPSRFVQQPDAINISP